VRALAVVMAVVCAVVAAGCVVVLIWGRYVHWRGFKFPVVVAFAVALVVAVAGPRLVVGGWDDVKGLVAWALMYSLPFAAGLVLSALMHRMAALVTTTMVACSALIATDGESFFSRIQPWGDAQTLVITAAAAVAATRLSPRRETASDEATTSYRRSSPSTR